MRADEAGGWDGWNRWGKLLLVLLVPAGSLVLVGKLVLVENWCWWKTGAGGKLAPMRLGGFSVRSKGWTSAERIYGKPCEFRGYPQASFVGVQTVHIGLKDVARARECASMGA